MSEYDTDIVSWSARKSDLLRRLATGERVNDATLDWPNIIEEIECAGRSEVRAVRSLLIQLLGHRLRLEGWPDPQAVRGWRKELRAFRRQLRADYKALMRHRIDLDDLYGIALDLLPELVDGRPPNPLSEHCPFTLDELLQEDTST